MLITNKGFTLVELLAVIAVLTIITLIVIFFAGSIINDSENNNIELSVKNYINAIENNVLSSRLENINIQDGTYSVMTNGNLCIGEYLEQECDGMILDLQLKEGKPIEGIVEIENKSVVSITDLNINNKIVSWDITNGFTIE